MKQRVLIIIFLLMILIAPAKSADVNTQVATQPSITTPQNVSFDNCTKIFAVDKEKLYYLTLGGISANNFIIEEIQTENGYIIFYAARNKYLATIAGVDEQNSILKITPCNEYYVFPPGVLVNIFKYIDVNLNIEIK